MLKDIQPINEKETREGFGEGIHELGKKNESIVQCGIGEANMMGIAAGLTIGGKIPYTTTFANFSTGRVYDQIRQSIAYSGKNVKICASHAGLTLGEDGATHQILEDLGMM